MSSIFGIQPELAGMMSNKEPPEAPQGFVVDTRYFVSGENWHRAELIGRWTGPGTASTINLPPLAVDSYLISIEVVGAASRKIFNGVAVFFNGVALTTRRVPSSPSKGISGYLSRCVAYVFPQLRPYPAKLLIVAQVFKKGRDQRNVLTIQVPFTVRPSKRVGHDIRRLGLCISKVAISPLSQPLP